MKTKHKKNTLFTFLCAVLISLLFVSSLLANDIPDLLEAITAEDGSVCGAAGRPADIVPVGDLAKVEPIC